MRRLLTLTCLLALACAAAVPAEAAGPRYGTVSRGWISATRSGPALRRMPGKANQLIAHFEWLRVPTPGLPLEIDWVTADGQLRAAWKNRTLRTDRPGTVLWTSIGRKVLGAQPGRWHVELRV